MNTVRDRLAQRAKANRIRLRDHLHPSYHAHAERLFAERPLYMAKMMALGAARALGHGEPHQIIERSHYVELRYQRVHLLVTPTSCRIVHIK
jgi:hypothetical protein